MGKQTRKDTTMATRSDEVRTEVAKAYGERVAQPAPAGCGCAAPPAQQGAIVELAGYSPHELAALPADAVVNSFGCGNPVALAGLRAGDVVLDLGSGAGIDLLLAAKIVGPTGRVIGVDMTAEMIARAEASIAAAGLENVEVRQGIIEELPVADASVDWVISNCVINLSPEKPRVFAEVARVLKPGGQMLVSDMVAKDLPPELLALPAAYSACVTGAISEDEYLAGLEAAGLTDVAVRDRLVYDAAQIAGYGASALEGACCGEQATGQLDALVRAYAGSLEGKVWSAKIYARKPE
jgi:SAM-dependent methyltransferase